MATFILRLPTSGPIESKTFADRSFPIPQGKTGSAFGDLLGDRIVGDRVYTAVDAKEFQNFDFEMVAQGRSLLYGVACKT